MKRFSVIICAIVIAATISGCAGWTVNGIRVDDLRKADGSECLKMAGGFVTSLVAHGAGHVAFLELKNEPWHMDGTSEIIDGPLTGESRQWFGRIGFITQLAVGGLLNLIDADRSFRAGYNVGTVAEIWSYPLLHATGNSDFRLIDEGGGNGSVEWAVYSAAAGYLLLDRDSKVEK
jgi:hypothetical protein